MAYPVTLNGRTYTLADFEGTNYVDGLPDAFEDFVTHAGNTYQTTSTTSIALGTGTKVFTVADSGKPYASGTPLRISNQADATDYIDALVTTYTGTTLTVNAIGYSGTGTIAAWNINIGGGPITVAGTLPINQGGTGATTAAAAATALGLGTGDTPTFAGLNVTGTANFGDVNITNVGDIALDTISSDAGTSVTVNLGSDAGDDFIVGSNYLVVEGDTGNVGIGCNPDSALEIRTATNNSSDTTYLKLSNLGENVGHIDFQNGNGNLARITGTKLGSGASANDGILTFSASLDSVLTERMRIDGATGNVGIGLNGASPASKLHVNGSFRQTGATAPFEWTVNAGASDYYKLNSVGYSDNIIVATAAGNVGIGTASPAQPLHVVGGAVQFQNTQTTYLQINTGDTHLYTAGSHPLRFGTNSQERLRIESSGHVKTSSGQFQAGGTNGLAVFSSGQTITVADGGTINLSSASSAQIICVGCASDGTGGAFFANYNTTVSQIGGSTSSVSTTDSGTVSIAVYKSAFDNTVTFKNRSGSTKVYRISIFCGENGGVT